MSQEGAQVENGTVTEAAPVLRITVSDVLGLLAQGKSRKEIAEYYGRTQSDMNKMVWGHPKLKNRKAKKQYTGIELEDDTEDINDVAEVPAETVVAEVVEAEVIEEHAVDASIYTGPTVENTVPDTSDWN
jgi:hypothetical protein